MAAISPRTRLVGWLVVAGVGLALFFGGDYRDVGWLDRLSLGGVSLGWIGMVVFVAATWFSVAALQRVPHGDAEAEVAPGEWQAWIGLAFVGAVLAAMLASQHLFGAPVPIGRNPDAMAAGRRIGTLFVAWLVLSRALAQRWAGSVVADERDARIELVAGQWARTATVVVVVGIAALLGFSDGARLHVFSFPYIAQLLMQALLWGALVEQLAKALLYRRDRRAAT